MSAKPGRAAVARSTQQLHGRRGRDAVGVGRRRAAPRASGATVHTTSPGSPSGSRDVASTCTPGSGCGSARRSGTMASSRCSQLSSTSSWLALAQHRDQRVLQLRCCRCCTSSAVATARRERAGSRTAASSTTAAPSSKSSRGRRQAPGQAGLAHAAGPDQRHQPARRAAARRARAQSLVAPDQRAGVVGDRPAAGARRGDGRSRRSSVGSSARIRCFQARAAPARRRGRARHAAGRATRRPAAALGLAARAVERHHQLTPEPLAQRVLGGQAFEIADQPRRHRRRPSGTRSTPRWRSWRSSSRRTASARIQSWSASSPNAGPRHQRQRRRVGRRRLAGLGEAAAPRRPAARTPRRRPTPAASSRQ